MTRLIWLAGPRVHPFLKVTLGRLGVAAELRESEIQSSDGKSDRVAME